MASELRQFCGHPAKVTACTDISTAAAPFMAAEQDIVTVSLIPEVETVLTYWICV